MEFELESVEYSADEQHHPGESGMILQSSDRQNVSDGNEILKESNMVSKSWYSFFLTINNINLIYIYH